MTDQFAQSPDSEQLESLLRDVFGTTLLSVKQRQQLATVAEGVQRPQPARVRANLHPLVRAVAVAAVLALAIGAVWWLDVFRQGSPADVSAAQRLLAPPERGSARHVVAEVYRRYSRDGGEKRWTSELWERTLPDGTRQLAVEAHGANGEPLGSYILSDGQWHVDYRGSTQSGGGEPSWLPEELAPLPYAVETVDASLATYDAEQIDVRADGDRQVIRVNLGDASAVGLTQAATDLGEPVEALTWEIEIDSKLKRVVKSRVIATGASGDELIVSGVTMSAWQELSASELDAARFTPPEEASEPDLALRIPDAGALPSNLSVISHYREDVPAGGPFSERAIFTGDGGLVVDLTISQKLAGSERTVRYPEGTEVHNVQTHVGPIEWSERIGRSGVTGAIWEDAAHFYYLSIQAPLDGMTDWSVDELVAFVEALAEVNP